MIYTSSAWKNLKGPWTTPLINKLFQLDLNYHFIPHFDSEKHIRYICNYLYLVASGNIVNSMFEMMCIFVRLVQVWLQLNICLSTLKKKIFDSVNIFLPFHYNFPFEIRRMWPYIWINLNSLHQRILNVNKICVKFCWNWQSTCFWRCKDTVC